MTDNDLFDGLELHIEVWNAAVPSSRIYSAIGPIVALTTPPASPADPPTTILRIAGPRRKEILSPAFSAADLDPERHRYPTLQDCINTAHAWDNPLELSVRLTVIDRRTGKRALAWEGGKETKYFVNAPSAWMSQIYLEGAFLVRGPWWTRLHRRRQEGSCSSAGTEEGLEEIKVNVNFLLHSLPNQEGVDELHKKYVVTEVPTYETALMSVFFKVPDIKTVANVLRSLLE